MKGTRLAEAAFEIVLKNAKKEATAVTVLEPIPGDRKNQAHFQYGVVEDRNTPGRENRADLPGASQVLNPITSQSTIRTRAKPPPSVRKLVVCPW